VWGVCGRLVRLPHVRVHVHVHPSPPSTLHPPPSALPPARYESGFAGLQALACTVRQGAWRSLDLGGNRVGEQWDGEGEAWKPTPEGALDWCR
jgi:hypothetical protein